MTSDLSTFTFVAESLAGAFDALNNLADAHHVGHVCIREVSGFRVVHVTTNAHIDCVLDAAVATDDDLIRASLRQLGWAEDVAE